VLTAHGVVKPDSKQVCVIIYVCVLYVG